jgi:hypothetical protein
VRLTPYLLKARESAEAGVRSLLSAAGDVRRMYVDPHVKSVWEKIAERETKTMGVAFDSAETKDVEQVASVTVDRETETEGMTQVASVTVDSKDVVSTPQVASVIVAQSSSISDILSSTHPIDPPLTQTSSSVSSSTQSIIPQPSSTPPNTNINMNEESEIDDFLKQLGLEETIASSPSPSPTSSSSDDESAKLAKASSAAQAQASTAAKRGDITLRHERWQEELDRAVLNVGRRVRGVLKGMREAAVTELGGKYRGKGEGERERGKGIVGDMEAEARRLVKGLEAYMKKVRGVAKDGEGKEEKEMWDMVVGKVEEKFQKEVVRVQREVHEWYVGVREREVGEVRGRGLFLFMCSIVD